MWGSSVVVVVVIRRLVVCYSLFAAGSRSNRSGRDEGRFALVAENGFVRHGLTRQNPVGSMNVGDTCSCNCCSSSLLLFLLKIHIEMTGKDVTECTGGDVDEVKEEDLKNRYLTQCDPR